MRKKMVSMNIMLKSAIYGKQQAWRELKKAYEDLYKYTFIDDEGELINLEGQEIRNQKVLDCWKEVMRLDGEIKRLKTESVKC